MGGNGPTIVKRQPDRIANIPDEELHDLIDLARRVIERGEERNWKPAYRENKQRQIVGDYKALRRAMRHLFPGSEMIVSPVRANGVDVLDVVLGKADGSFVIIEAKFTTDGGRIRYGQTNGYIFEADETGLVRRVKVPRMNKQLSRQWVQ
jgi:hypothetical protein